MPQMVSVLSVVLLLAALCSFGAPVHADELAPPAAGSGLMLRLARQQGTVDQWFGTAVAHRLPQLATLTHLPVSTKDGLTLVASALRVVDPGTAFSDTVFWEGDPYVAVVLRNDTDQTIWHRDLRIVGVTAQGQPAGGRWERMLPSAIPPGGIAFVAALPPPERPLEVASLDFETRPAEADLLQDLETVPMGVDWAGRVQATIINNGPLLGPAPFGRPWGKAMIACWDEAGEILGISTLQELSFPLDFNTVGKRKNVSFAAEDRNCPRWLMSVALQPFP